MRDREKMLASNCHVCGKTAFRTCVLCGRPACGDHMDEKGLFCTVCSSGVKKSRGSGDPGDPGGVMG